jgi:trigger factor
LDALNVQYKITLPKSAVDHEFQQIWKKLEDEIAAGKARGEKDDVDRKAAETEYREIAERRVRLGFVISEIAKEHKISLTNEEIQRVVMKEALNYPQQFKEVVDFYVKNKHALERLIAPAIEDKVVDFVFDKSKKKQTKITTQELPTKLKGVVPGYEDDEPAPKKEAKAKAAEIKEPKQSKSEGEKAPAKTATTKKGK